MTVPAPSLEQRNLTDEEIRDSGRLDTSSGFTLDQEKFETAKELTELTAAIGEARQALRDLEDTKGEFLLQREKEAMDRIMALIERSHGALRQVTENHDELRALVADTKELTKRVLGIKDSVIQMAADFKAESEEMLKDLDSRENGVAEQARQNAADRDIIAAERTQLEYQKTAIKEEEEKIASQREELAGGFRELKAKAKT